ncbi:MAG: indole-3-glycerol phosphate synthase [Micavibrio sp.]|nr:MAG: indole-3-glycerol phosphate synthase [Micavibrio sp.]
MNKLDEICARKKEHVRSKKAETSVDGLRYTIGDLPPPRGFIGTIIERGAPALIAEVKKASPSKGIIRENFDPVEIAKSYERAGAACVSVLTDEPYFQGQDSYLVQIKDAIALPVLRKDFMIDPYQIYESRALGADCVLLIMAALDDSLAQELYDLASELGMDVLVEIHDEPELQRALKLNPEMIGVNSRNLKTLEVDIQTAHDLAPPIPDTTLKIAESGIGSNQDIKALQNSGYSAFLVGESLMRQDDIEAATRNLITK